jgi:hypothetical protein
MPIVTLLLVIVVVGVLLWAVNTHVPMAASIKQIFNAVVVILLILWLLSVFGVLPSLGRLRVPRAR